MAYSGALSAAGLEHRRSLGRQVPALAGPARIFPAATGIRMATCGGPSLAQLFHPQGALCATIMREPPRRWKPAVLARTPPVAGNPVPSAVASGYRPCQ